MLHEQLEILSQEKIYENNFLQMQKIGQGGFASVYRVQHKIDDTEYAVKQIHLKIKDVKDDLQKHYEKLIREAKYLAQVNHPNVIRYFHSWIEVTEKKKQQKQEEQKRQTMELSTSFTKKKKSNNNNKDQLSPTKKETAKDKGSNNQQPSNALPNSQLKQQQEEKSKSIADNNKEKKVEQNQTQASRQKDSSSLVQVATNNVGGQNNANNSQKDKGKGHNQHNGNKKGNQQINQKEDHSDDDNNEEPSFYFECDGNEVVFYEENSKSIKQDESQQDISQSSAINQNQSSPNSNNDMSEQSPNTGSSKQRTSQMRIFNSKNGNSAEIIESRKSNKEGKKPSEFASMHQGNNNDDSQDNESSISFNNKQSDFQMVFESYSQSDLKDDFEAKKTSNKHQKKEQVQGNQSVSSTSPDSQKQQGERNNKNNKNQEENDQNKQQIQQDQQNNQQQNISNSIHNTKSYERRKNKSMDYLTIDQKQREFQLDKYDEIIFYLQTELCHQTLAEYITNRNKKIFALQSMSSMQVNSKFSNTNGSNNNNANNTNNNGNNHHQNNKNQNTYALSSGSIKESNQQQTSNSTNCNNNSTNNNNNLGNISLTYSYSANNSTNDPNEILPSDYKQQAISILKEVIKGLYHIHHICKMVHRDLKPHNIFLTDNMQVKIGDFGLVKKLSKLINPNQKIQYNDHQLYGPKLGNDNSGMKQTSTNNSFSAASTSPSETNSGYHDKLPFYLPKEEITSTCGTATYASPEQLSQKAEFFDHRADIYSLGIIIMQLFYPMNTTMELVKTIQNCKKGELPKSFCARFPRLAEIIKDSLSNDPQKRPLLSKIEQTLQEMEIQESQHHSETLGKLMITFEQETTQIVKFVKVIRNCLYFYKSECSNKAENVYNIQECTFKLIMSQHDGTSFEEISVSHPIQQNFSLRAATNEKTQHLIQKLQKYSMF